MPSPCSRPDRATWPALPSGARWAIDLVRTSDDLSGAVGTALARVAVVDDVEAARRLVDAHDLVAATRAGDLVARGVVQGGSASAPSLLEVQAAVDEARAGLTEATHR